MSEATTAAGQPTEFEMKVLRLIGQGTRFSGNRMVAYVAAARRLERKGLASKLLKWHTTDAGRQVLAAEGGLQE